MTNKFKRIFCPTPEEEADDLKRLIAIYKELSQEEWCCTCANAKHVVSYPGFVTGEEYECTAGFECDTVLNTVKNCPRWKKVSLTKLYKKVEK